MSPPWLWSLLGLHRDHAHQHVPLEPVPLWGNMGVVWVGTPTNLGVYNHPG